MSLAVRDEELAELMDDPACDPERLRATLRRFGTINRVVSGWGTVYRTRLGPFLAALGRPAHVLDLGSGGGDLVRRLAAAAERDGLDVRWTGADPDPRAQEVAAAHDARRNMTFRCTDAATLLAGGETFDAVLSNHVLHHLADGTAAFLDESRLLSRGLVLHGDIARSRLAYGLYAVGITPFAPGTFLRTDGLRSIRRSFTPRELQASLDAASPGAWEVATPVAFRVLAVGSGLADGGRGASADRVRGASADQFRGGPADELREGPADQLRGGAADQLRRGPSDQLHGGPADQLRGGPAAQDHRDPAAQQHGAPADQFRGAPAAQPHGAAADQLRRGPADQLRVRREDVGHA